MLIYPVFIPFQGCPFRCIYCQQETITHQASDSFTIDTEKIKQFIHKNAGIDKEIAFFGGTFTALKSEVQKQLFSQALKLFDDKTSFRISTRPDFINKNILSFLKENHVRTIELGIQSFQENVLKKSYRGYTVNQATEACKLIIENHFKLCIQLMPGLPGDRIETFLKSAEIALSLKPDYLRLYPTIVLKGTELERMYYEGLFEPWNLDEALLAVSAVVKKTEVSPTKIIKIGLHSDLNITKKEVISGPWHQNFGELIKGIIFLEKCLSHVKQAKILYISPFDASLLLGNQKYVLDFCKNKLSLKLPEKIIVDKTLKKESYYIQEINMEEI